jgi:hypothetical protein
MGALVQVYVSHAMDCPDCEMLASLSKPFGPVVVGINPMIRLKRWQVIGYCEPNPEVNTQFLWAVGYAKGVPANWYLTDTRGNEIRLGAMVPKELRDLEMFAVISGDFLEDRLRTGINYLSYDHVMKIVAGEI